MSNSLSQIDGEDDAADIGARQRRVEHVGILGEADAQVWSAPARCPPAPAESASESGQGAERLFHDASRLSRYERRLQAVAAAIRSSVLRRALRRATARRRELGPERAGRSMACAVVGKRRNVAPAALAGEAGSACGSGSPAAGAIGARDVALEQRALAHRRRIGQRHGRQQGARVGMARDCGTARRSSRSPRSCRGTSRRCGRRCASRPRDRG